MYTAPWTCRLLMAFCGLFHQQLNWNIMFQLTSEYSKQDLRDLASSSDINDIINLLCHWIPCTAKPGTMMIRCCGLKPHTMKNLHCKHEANHELLCIPTLYHPWTLNHIYPPSILHGRNDRSVGAWPTWPAHWTGTMRSLGLCWSVALVHASVSESDICAQIQKALQATMSKRNTMGRSSDQCMSAYLNTTSIIKPYFAFTGTVCGKPNTSRWTWKTNNCSSCCDIYSTNLLAMPLKVIPFFGNRVVRFHSAQQWRN